MNKKFGIIIATCKTDKHFAQACFLSIRRSLGSSMPVCFIVDGEAEILGHNCTIQMFLSLTAIP